MRKCIRCQAEMIENLDVKVEGRADGIKVKQPGIFKENLGRLQCAVCPQCGYAETYIADVSKIRKLKIKE